MSEDGKITEEARGNTFPSQDDSEQLPIIVLLNSRRQTADEDLKHFEQRAREYWPRYRIALYKALLIAFAEKNSLSPQKLYDLIMEPEIKQNIRDYRIKHGVNLSAVEARPHRDGNGRDIIRKWLYRDDGTVAHGFLKYVRRFVRKEWRTFIQFQHARENVQLERARYHCVAIRDMIGERTYFDQHTSILAVGRRYDFLLCSESNAEDSPFHRILRLQLFPEMVGEFLVIDADSTLVRNAKAGKANVLREGVQKSDLRLRFRGYFFAPISQPIAGSFPERLDLQIAFAVDHDASDGLFPSVQQVRTDFSMITLKYGRTSENDPEALFLLDYRDGSYPEYFRFSEGKIELRRRNGDAAAWLSRREDAVFKAYALSLNQGEQDMIRKVANGLIHV